MGELPPKLAVLDSLSLPVHSHAVATAESSQPASPLQPEQLTRALGLPSLAFQSAQPRNSYPQPILPNSCIVFHSTCPLCSDMPHEHASSATAFALFCSANTASCVHDIFMLTTFMSQHCLWQPSSLLMRLWFFAFWFFPSFLVIFRLLFTSVQVIASSASQPWILRIF